MKDRQRFLRVVLTTVASVLLSVLVVFALVNAQSKLTATTVEVGGSIVTKGAAVISAVEDSNKPVGLVVPFGKVGIGYGAADQGDPQHTLDVRGDINFTGTLFKNGVEFVGEGVKKNNGDSCADPKAAVIAKKWFRPRVDNHPSCSAFGNSCISEINEWRLGSDPGLSSCQYWVNPDPPNPLNCQAVEQLPSVTQVACIGD